MYQITNFILFDGTIIIPLQPKGLKLQHRALCHPGLWGLDLRFFGRLAASLCVAFFHKIPDAPFFVAKCQDWSRLYNDRSFAAWHSGANCGQLRFIYGAYIQYVCVCNLPLRDAVGKLPLPFDSFATGYGSGINHCRSGVINRPRATSQLYSDAASGSGYTKIMPTVRSHVCIIMCTDWTSALIERKPPPTSKFEPNVIRDLNPDFRINPYPGSGCLSQNVVGALSCRRQSFRQVWYKSAVDCMRNANKCPIIPYSAVMKKTKKWSGIHMQIRITTRHPHSHHPSLFHSRLKTYLFNKAFPP